MVRECFRYQGGTGTSKLRKSNLGVGLGLGMGMGMGVASGDETSPTQITRYYTTSSRAGDGNPPGLNTIDAAITDEVFEL